MNESCLNNLNDVYKQYCKGARPLEKQLRDVFVTGTVDDVIQNFQVNSVIIRLFIHSFIHSFIHPCIIRFIHTLCHSL